MKIFLYIAYDKLFKERITIIENKLTFKKISLKKSRKVKTKSY